MPGDRAVLIVAFLKYVVLHRTIGIGKSDCLSFICHLPSTSTVPLSLTFLLLRRHSSREMQHLFPIVHEYIQSILSACLWEAWLYCLQSGDLSFVAQLKVSHIRTLTTARRERVGASEGRKDESVSSDALMQYLCCTQFGWQVQSP